MIPKLRRKSTEDIELRPVSPSHQRRVRVYGAITVVLLVVVAFFAGQGIAERSASQDSRERMVLREQVRELEAQLESARDELALHRTGSEVAQQAQEQVREELRSLHEQQAELKEAVAFYKSVMDPGAGDEGLRIERFRLRPDGRDRVYQYRLVLAQVVEDRGFISGQVRVRLAGERDGESVELDDVLHGDSSTAFRFRYFQEMDGLLELPEGFAPREVHVEAVRSGGRERARETFSWQVRE